MVQNFVVLVGFACLLAAFVYGAPPALSQPRFQIKTDSFHQEPNLEYTFTQEFTNGEKFSEDGKLKTVNGMDVIVTKGSYTIINPDGTETLVNYTADEDGFHPEVISPAV